MNLNKLHASRRSISKYKTRFNDAVLNTVNDYTSKAFSLMIYWIKSDIWLRKVSV